MWSLGVVSAVALACLVVAVTLERVAVSVTLTGDTAAAPSQGGAEAPRSAVLTVRSCSPVLAFITDSRSSDTGGVEVAATVDVAFDTAQNQSGGVGCPTQGAFTLKPRAAAALTLTAFIVTSLVAVQRAVASVSSLTMTLIRGGSVDTSGERVTVVEAQPAFLHVRTCGIRPDRIFLLFIKNLQLHLHFQGSGWS